MAARGDSTDSILSKFTYQNLPRIVGIPTYATIQLLSNDLKANAACISSELGCGALGHLTLTVSPNIYTTLSNTPWAAPVNPGPVPPALLANTTAAQIANNRDHYTDRLRVYRLCDNVQNALKQQLLAAVDDISVRILRNTHTGYAGVTVIQILEHLYRTYGLLTPMAMTENDKAFRTPTTQLSPSKCSFNKLKRPKFSH
jgi:hypothetical protein